MTPSAVIAGSAAFGAGFLAHGLQLFSARIAAIGFTLREELLSDLPATLGARELVDGLAVPIKLEPTQAVENGEDRAFGRARLVGVLDAQQHVPAGLLGIEPIEQVGPCPCYMQIAVGRRGTARDAVL